MSETVSNGEGSTGLSESETGRHHHPGLHQGDVHTEDLHGGTQRMNKELTRTCSCVVPLTIKALRIPPFPFGPFLETLGPLFNSLELRELAASRRQFQRERLGSSPPLSLSLSRGRSDTRSCLCVPFPHRSSCCTTRL